MTLAATFDKLMVFLPQVTCDASMDMSQHVAEADQQLAALNSRLASNTADLAKLAESVGSCLAAARADAAAAAAAAGPSSYLSTLLAPVGAGTAAGSVNGSIGGAAAARRGPQWSAWVRRLCTS